jgi:hypothetical protein
MGDRFYQAQLKELGTCPGYTGKRKKNMAWDDAKKAKAVKMYSDANPTPDNSMEIVKEIADALEESPNGVRMILTKADVYVKKADAKASAGNTAKASEGGARVSKEGAHARLTAAINTIGGTVNDEIISKLTGKAAIYIAELLETAAK